MTTCTVAVVSAGLSQPSSTRLLADQLAGAVRTGAADRGDRVEVITLELRELAHDITDNLLTGFPGVALQTALEAVSSADALIAVTPVFSGSYSGLFKSFFDVLDREALVGTPVLLAATGGSARHSLVLDYALRPLFSHLKAGHRADRGVRGHRGLRVRRIGRSRPVVGRPDRPGCRRAAGPAQSGCRRDGRSGNPSRARTGAACSGCPQ